MFAKVQKPTAEWQMIRCLQEPKFSVIALIRYKNIDQLTFASPFSMRRIPHVCASSVGREIFKRCMYPCNRHRRLVMYASPWAVAWRAG